LDYQVDVVVDVRTAPYCPRALHFDRAALRTHLRQLGLVYEDRGDVLGSHPASPLLYDDEGHARYDLIAADPAFKEAALELVDLAQTKRVILLCGEAEPALCHRYRLIGRVLTEQGHEIWHIAALGRRFSYDEVEAKAGHPAATKPWRSVFRAISPFDGA